MQVKTEQYQFSTGRRPKGFGWWLFQIGGKSAMEFWFGATGNYGYAKGEAIKEARKQGALHITVLP